MPRRSAAELEATLCFREQNGREVEVNPPQSLTTAAQRDAFREVLFRCPQVTTKRNFEGALGNYILLQAKARRLCNDVDRPEYFEVMHGIRSLERFLGLPSSTEPVRRKTVGCST